MQTEGKTMPTSIIGDLDVDNLFEEAKAGLTTFDGFMDSPNEQKIAVLGILAGEEIALQHLHTAKKNAKEYWRSLSWSEQQLEMAKMNDPRLTKASELMQRIDEFPVVKTLITAAMNIIRVVEDSTGFRDLAPLCKKLFEEGQITEIKKETMESIKIRLNGKDEMFLVASTPAAKVAWSYVIKAHIKASEKVQEQQERANAKFQELKAIAQEMRKEFLHTPLLTILERGHGDYLLPLDGGKLILLRFSAKGEKDIWVEIPKVNYSDKFAWRKILISSEDFKSLGRGHWPDDEAIYMGALRRIRYAETKRKEAREEMASAMEDVDTYQFSEKGLIRLLTGEKITVGISETNFKWEGAQGKVVLVVSPAEEEGKVVISKISTDIDFPEELVNTPIEVKLQDHEEAPKVFVTFPVGLSPNDRILKGYKCLRLLLLRRINAESNT